MLRSKLAGTRLAKLPIEEATMPKRPRVLVVDDDPAMREMIVCMLETAGFDAESAADADEALFALRDREFALVVSDVYMPGRDGFALARALPWVRPGTPIVLMSAFPCRESAAEARRAGASGFIAKPFSTRDLRAAVCGALARAALAAGGAAPAVPLSAPS